MSEILFRCNDIEIPKNGTLTLVIHPNGDVYLGDVLRDIKMGKATVLSPHGELIERDRAINEMEYVSFDTAHNCELAQEVLRYNVPVFLEASNDKK